MNIHSREAVYQSIILNLISQTDHWEIRLCLVLYCYFSSFRCHLHFYWKRETATEVKMIIAFNSQQPKLGNCFQMEIGRLSVALLPIVPSLSFCVPPYLTLFYSCSSCAPVLLNQTQQHNVVAHLLDISYLTLNSIFWTLGSFSMRNSMNYMHLNSILYELYALKHSWIDFFIFFIIV